MPTHEQERAWANELHGTSIEAATEEQLFSLQYRVMTGQIRLKDEKQELLESIRRELYLRANY